MNNPLFRDNVEDKEINFLIPEDKDIVVNKDLLGKSEKRGKYGR